MGPMVLLKLFPTISIQSKKVQLERYNFWFFPSDLIIERSTMFVGCHLKCWILHLYDNQTGDG